MGHSENQGTRQYLTDLPRPPLGPGEVSQVLPSAIKQGLRKPTCDPKPLDGAGLSISLILEMIMFSFHMSHRSPPLVYFQDLDIRTWFLFSIDPILARSRQHLGSSE
jgi:hypothetical protein